MKAKKQKELLLCALKHFEIDVLHIEKGKVTLAGQYEVCLADGQPYQLMQKGQARATFNDVVKLCTFLNLDLESNEEAGIENSSSGQQRSTTQ